MCKYLRLSGKEGSQTTGTILIIFFLSISFLILLFKHVHVFFFLKTFSVVYDLLMSCLFFSFNYWNIRKIYLPPLSFLLLTPYPFRSVSWPLNLCLDLIISQNSLRVYFPCLLTVLVLTPLPSFPSLSVFGFLNSVFFLLFLFCFSPWSSTELHLLKPHTKLFLPFNLKIYSLTLCSKSFPIFSLNSCLGLIYS